MKLLHREDVLEAGYDLPTTGLCANIGDTEMQELRFGGEWILAEDETLVADGHEQRYLYMVVSGEVAITKINDQGKTQQIATLGTGAAFGEMAFLSGGIASANVQSIGETILWRMDHEALLGFIGEFGVAGGQLCLNVASILSGRLVEGNKKVIDMGKELQASLAQLKAVAGAGTGKSNQALQQMQGKVANMQNAFKGGAVKKSSNIFAMASTVVAVLSTLGMIGLFVSYDDSSVQEAASLGIKVKKLEANEEFYLNLKRRLEEENKELLADQKAVRREKDDIAKSLSDSMADAQNLQGEIDRLEDELSEAKDDLVRAQKVEPVKPVASTPEKKAELAKSLTDEMLAWAKSNSTLVFPLEIEVRNKHITLTDRAKQVQIPVKQGGAVRAMQIHPTAPQYLVVAQLNSDKFMAVVPIKDSSFIEVLLPKYESHSKAAGKQVSIPANFKAGASANDSSSTSNSNSPTASLASGELSPLSPTIAKGTAINPQKPENVLDSMPAKKEKVDTSDHGANCVCKDCRVKKIGKGSLFPDL